MGIYKQIRKLNLKINLKRLHVKYMLKGETLTKSF